MAENEAYRFQIDLSGIIKLLSSHLYSSPQVYLRELLQNAVDAITARRHLESSHEGTINIRIVETADSRPPVLIFEDNGIGLSEDEVHRCLAMIGHSSKRCDVDWQPSDFIGQFGIGLLSCFVVSDEIVVVTRSTKGKETIEWRGRSSGAYTVAKLADEMSAGTKVTLRCKQGFEEYFDPARVRQMAKHFGGLLPYPIRILLGNETERINEEPPPWRQDFLDSQQERDVYLNYGRQIFGIEFFDYIRLQSTIGDVEGVAFVLPFSPSLAMKKTHRVYLKNMLLSENAEGLLPDWAFFVKGVVNANDLRPMASRESFYEDEALAATRATLGQVLRRYLLDLAKNDKRRLQRLISLQYMSIKALAVADDDFFQIFVDWLPFETSSGWMSLGEYKQQNDVIRYVSDMDQFRQISQIAAAQSLCVINSAYAYDTDLLRQHEALFPETPTESIDVTTITHNFDYLTLDEQEEVSEFVDLAREVLRPFQCSAEARRFSPREMPVLYSADREMVFRRAVQQAREVTDSLWSSILNNFSSASAEEDRAQLCFNYNNPLVVKICQMKDREMQRRSVRLLYVQSLLFSHRPLSSKEMKLLNEDLLGLIEWSVDVGGGWIQ